MDETAMDDPSGMVLYEEEVTTANGKLGKFLKINFWIISEIMPCVSNWEEQKSVGFELTDTKCYKWVFSFENC